MEVKVIRSNRKTFTIQVNPDLTVTVRAPRRATQKEIDNLLKSKESWINKHLNIMQDRLDKVGSLEANSISDDQIRELSVRAKKYIPARVSYFAEKLGVEYGRITIRCQKTRWGSCSSEQNLNFNCLLMLAPPEVIDYVVVHELCHLKEMNHSNRFWNDVADIIPNYKEYADWLKKEGTQIMLRATAK